MRYGSENKYRASLKCYALTVRVPGTLVFLAHLAFFLSIAGEFKKQERQNNGSCAIGPFGLIFGSVPRSNDAFLWKTCVSSPLDFYDSYIINTGFISDALYSPRN